MPNKGKSNHGRYHCVDLALIIEEEDGVRIEDFELNADTFDTIEELAQLIAERQ